MSLGKWFIFKQQNKFDFVGWEHEWMLDTDMLWNSGFKIRFHKKLIIILDGCKLSISSNRDQQRVRPLSMDILNLNEKLTVIF